MAENSTNSGTRIKQGVASLSAAEVYAALAHQAEAMLADAKQNHSGDLMVAATCDTLRMEIERLRSAEAEMLRDAKQAGVIA